MRGKRIIKFQSPNLSPTTIQSKIHLENETIKNQMNNEHIENESIACRKREEKETE
jgi:hypothetical protein